MKKRRQHYVWQHYLKPWATDNKIFCLRDNKVFESSLIGIANERDFYRLKELNKEDIAFIEKLVIEQSPKLLQKLHTNLIKQFNFVFDLKSFIQSQGIDNPVVSEKIEETVNNLEEDFHSRIEDSVIGHIESIRSGNTDFFNNDKGFIDFIYFLCVQYMRTKKVKTSVIANVRPPENIDIEKIWNILSHIFATNMGGSLYTDRKNFRLLLLDNRSSAPFITGDQPVVNTYATGDLKNPPQQLELYYPVSPVTAVLLTESKKYEADKQRSVGLVEATAYNEHIVRNRHDQIFAASRKALEAYVHL